MTKLPFEKELREKLAVSGSYLIDYPQESILGYQKVCNHDHGYFCEHRLNWLIKYLEEKWSQKNT